MALIAIAADKGSPGVTTSALALAAVWPRRVLLAETDPAGGDLVYRSRAAHGGTLDPNSGMLSLAATARRGLAAEQLWDHAQPLTGGLDVLVGLVGNEPMTRAAGHDGNAELHPEDRAIGRARDAAEDGAPSGGLPNAGDHRLHQRLSALDPRRQAESVHGRPLDRAPWAARHRLVAGKIDLARHGRLVGARREPHVEDRPRARGNHVRLLEALSR